MRDSKQLQEKEMKEERMQEVLLLLEHLISHEEVTIKLIIACLFDVGSVNLINQRIRQPLVKRSLKGIIGVSKPVAKAIGFRWFKRNCPQLITNWLYSKVSFPEAILSEPAEVIPAPVVAEQTALVSENLNHEIRRLKGQVRLLSGISIGAIAALSGVLVWMNNRPEVGASHPNVQPAQPITTRTIESHIQPER